MKLTKVGLENSGAFRTIVLSELSGGLNVVLGETGSGKSTLRHGLAAIFYEEQTPHVKPDRQWEARPAGEIGVSVGSETFQFRRVFGERATGSAALLATTPGVANRSLSRQLGELSATDYTTFFNLSFVDAPDIERRMVRSLLDRFGVARAGSTWSSEAEYRRWREEATQRRDRLTLDENQWTRLTGRRDRVRAELADAELHHRTQVSELEQSRDRARSELSGLESERSGVVVRMRELELELRQAEEQSRARFTTKTVVETPSNESLRLLYGKLDRIQAEIRRTLAVKRDLLRRRQVLARIRARLTDEDDSLEQWQARNLRRHLMRLEQHIEHWTSAWPLALRKERDEVEIRKTREQLEWERSTDWSRVEVKTSGTLPPESVLTHWTWPVDEHTIPLEAEELRRRSPEQRLVTGPTWTIVREELESLRRELGRFAVAAQRQRIRSERRDLGRCEAELRRRLGWLRRRREARLAQISRWDADGHQLWRNGETRFLRYARQHGSWEARLHFVGPLTDRAEVTVSEDPLLAQKVRELRAELARLQNRLSELERLIGEARRRWESLATQLQSLRDSLNLDGLRRELHDVQFEIDQLEPRLRKLREEVRRDEPLWALKYDSLIDRASDWCRQLTGGRLNRVGVDATHQRLVAIEASAERSFHTLPRDLQDLVCLSFCLAVAQRMTDHGTPITLVIDDLLVNLDAQRSQTVMDTLWDFVGLGHQIVLFAAERQVSSRWLSRPLSVAEQTRLAVFQLPDAASTQQRTQWPLVLRPLTLTKSVAAPPPVEVVPQPIRWPLITEQTPLAHLDLIEPEWLLVLSKHRLLLIGDLLDLVPDELPQSLRMHGLTAGQVDRWQSQCWLLCCVPGLRPYDVRLLVGSGITEPEQLEEFSAGDVLRRLEIYLATEEGQRVMQSGTADERARLHSWMNGLRENRQTWGAKRSGRTYGNRRQRWQQENQRADAAPAMKIHQPPTSGSAPVSSSSSTSGLVFYLSLDDELEKAPSIGTKMAERFGEVGIVTVRQFVESNGEELARKLKVRRLDLKTLEEWQRQARLICRVPNLRGHDAQLLVACDIDTPEAMLRFTPVELLAKVTPVAKSKEGQRILRSSPAPDLAEVTDWLTWAKQSRLLQVA
ncbi:MAG: DUF4332 domain-containing protein [Planctomycetaceae bacterium]|nr:DUF4332 domain-containing protein [Planctomycetaceae bacterium]